MTWLFEEQLNDVHYCRRVFNDFTQWENLDSYSKHQILSRHKSIFKQALNDYRFRDADEIRDTISSAITPGGIMYLNTVNHICNEYGQVDHNFCEEIYNNELVFTNLTDYVKGLIVGRCPKLLAREMAGSELNGGYRLRTRFPQAFSETISHNLHNFKICEKLFSNPLIFAGLDINVQARMLANHRIFFDQVLAAIELGNSIHADMYLKALSKSIDLHYLKDTKLCAFLYHKPQVFQKLSSDVQGYILGQYPKLMKEALETGRIFELHPLALSIATGCYAGNILPETYQHDLFNTRVIERDRKCVTVQRNRATEKERLGILLSIASNAHLWKQLRPGTQCFLALSIKHANIQDSKLEMDLATKTRLDKTTFDSYMPDGRDGYRWNENDGWTHSYAGIAGIGPRRDVLDEETPYRSSHGPSNRYLQWSLLVKPFFDGTSTRVSALEMYANVLISDRYFDVYIKNVKETGKVDYSYNCENLRVYLGLRYASVAARLIQDPSNCGMPSEVSEAELEAMADKHGLSIKDLREAATADSRAVEGSNPDVIKRQKEHEEKQRLEKELEEKQRLEKEQEEKQRLERQLALQRETALRKELEEASKLAMENLAAAAATPNESEQNPNPVPLVFRQASPSAPIVPVQQPASLPSKERRSYCSFL